MLTYLKIYYFKKKWTFIWGGRHQLIQKDTWPKDKTSGANWGKKKFRRSCGVKGTPTKESKDMTFQNAGKREDFKRRNAGNVAPLAT